MSDGFIYIVHDTHTGLDVRRYKTLIAALRAKDKLDDQYGGYRYTIRRIYK